MKSQQIQNFFKLLKVFNRNLIIANELTDKKRLIFLNDLNNLLKLTIKYQILQTFLSKRKILGNNFSFDKYENQSIQISYKKIFRQVNFLLGEKSLNFKKLTQILEEQIEFEDFIYSNNLYKLYQNEIEFRYFKLWLQKLNKYDNILNIYKKKTKKVLIGNTFLIFSDILEKVEELNFLKTKINRKFNNLKKILIIFEKSINLKSIIHFPIIKNYRRSDIIKNKNYFEKKEIYKYKY